MDNKKANYEKMILIILIIALMSFPLMIPKVYSNGAYDENGGSYGSGNPEVPGNGANGNGESSCNIVCCPYHYDYAYEVKPTIKVTITDEKYKVLNNEGNWEPLKLIYYVETYVLDDIYH